MTFRVSLAGACLKRCARLKWEGSHDSTFEVVRSVGEHLSRRMWREAGDACARERVSCPEVSSFEYGCC